MTRKIPTSNWLDLEGNMKILTDYAQNPPRTLHQGTLHHSVVPNIWLTDDEMTHVIAIRKSEGKVFWATMLYNHAIMCPIFKFLNLNACFISQIEIIQK